MCGGPVHRLTVNYYYCVLTGAACLLAQWAGRQKQREEGKGLEKPMMNHIFIVTDYFVTSVPTVSQINITQYSIISVSMGFKGAMLPALVNTIRENYKKN